MRVVAAKRILDKSYLFDCSFSVKFAITKSKITQYIGVTFNPYGWKVEHISQDEAKVFTLGSIPKWFRYAIRRRERITDLRRTNIFQPHSCHRANKKLFVQNLPDTDIKIHNPSSDEESATLCINYRKYYGKSSKISP